MPKHIRSDFLKLFCHFTLDDFLKASTTINLTFALFQAFRYQRLSNFISFLLSPAFPLSLLRLESKLKFMCTSLFHGCFVGKQKKASEQIDHFKSFEWCVGGEWAAWKKVAPSEHMQAQQSAIHYWIGFWPRPYIMHISVNLIPPSKAL